MPVYIVVSKLLLALGPVILAVGTRSVVARLAVNLAAGLASLVGAVVVDAAVLQDPVLALSIVFIRAVDGPPSRVRAVLAGLPQTVLVEGAVR